MIWRQIQIKDCEKQHHFTGCTAAQKQQVLCPGPKSDLQQASASPSRVLLLNLFSMLVWDLVHHPFTLTRPSQGLWFNFDDMTPERKEEHLCLWKLMKVPPLGRNNTYMLRPILPSHTTTRAMRRGLQECGITGHATVVVPFTDVIVRTTATSATTTAAITLKMCRSLPHDTQEIVLPYQQTTNHHLGVREHSWEVRNHFTTGALRFILYVLRCGNRSFTARSFPFNRQVHCKPIWNTMGSLQVAFKQTRWIYPAITSPLPLVCLISCSAQYATLH